MADLTMCDNQECILKNNCYRAMAEPSYKQVYKIFKPDSPDNCYHFVQLVRHYEVAEQNNLF